MKFLPNLLTSLNLFCGLLSILFIVSDNIVGALIALAISLIADVFDGLVARMVGSDSDFGKELDSLADGISFGAVPGIIMAKLIQDSLGLEFMPDALWANGFPWMLIGLLVAVFSALRLAKFNLDTRQSTDFYGLPTPANGVLIYSYWMTIAFDGTSAFGSFLAQTPVLVILSLVSCWLLVADIRLMSLKVKDFSWENNMYKYLLLISSLLLLGFLTYRAIPIMVILYIAFSTIENWRK